MNWELQNLQRDFDRLKWEVEMRVRTEDFNRTKYELEKAESKINSLENTIYDLDRRLNEMRDEIEQMRIVPISPPHRMIN